MLNLSKKISLLFLTLQLLAMEQTIKIGNRVVTLKTDVVRMGYIPENEFGREEYVLVFKGSQVPQDFEEPELFEDAKIDCYTPREIGLSYPADKVDVILLTKWEDDNFRRDNPDKIDSMEKLRIGHYKHKGQKYLKIIISPTK
jgi:hypothetical protein